MQTGNGALHRQHGGVQDVQLINLFRFSAAQAPRQRFLFDFIKQRKAALFRQLFGIRQAGNQPRRIEDHGGGHHGTDQRATSDFINAGNQPGVRIDKFSHWQSPVPHPPPVRRRSSESADAIG